jgi:hypothetical protein
MRMMARFVALVLCAVALVTLAGASGGCAQSSDNPAPQWERVTSAQVSGDRPVKLYLGAYPLGDRVRLAWVLSGPENPPVTLTLRIIDVKTGRGYGYTVTPESEGHAISRRDDQAISLVLVPGEYRVFFSQRFRQALGPGYDITFAVYTMKSTP